MSNTSKEKFTAVEVIYLILAFTVVVASLCFVLAKQNISQEEVIANFSQSGNEYDVSVINNLTADDLMKVGGIGKVKANAIITYRDSLGGFDNVYQLLDVKGVSAQNFEDILISFYIDPISEVMEDEASEPLDITAPTADGDGASPVDNSQAIDDGNTQAAVSSGKEEKAMRFVNINTASANEISECLLLELERAEQIVEIRELIGGYNNIQEVLLCNLISEDIYARIKPYLLLE